MATRSEALERTHRRTAHVRCRTSQSAGVQSRCAPGADSLHPVPCRVHFAAQPLLAPPRPSRSLNGYNPACQSGVNAQAQRCRSHSRKNDAGINFLAFQRDGSETRSLVSGPVVMPALAPVSRLTRSPTRTCQQDPDLSVHFRPPAHATRRQR
jgi:hypothetical protein